MLYCVCQNGSSIIISDFSAISQVIIAVVNICLASYVILYQISKDKKTDNDTAQLNEQNIKLQWFKELIIHPNITLVNRFYENLSTIENKILSNDLTLEQKEDINLFVKTELIKIRKSFIDIVLHVDNKLAKELLNNLDTLVDEITDAIFNDDLKLKKNTVFEKYIGSKISYSKSKFISQIYSYKGISAN